MITKEVLVKARELITDKRYWCQGAYTTFKYIGDVCYEQHCVNGAIKAALHSFVDFEYCIDNCEQLTQAINKLYSVNGAIKSSITRTTIFQQDGQATSLKLISINDHYWGGGHKAVLEVLDEAISQF